MEYLLHHLLTESSSQWPQNEAVRFMGESLTYEQLDRITNQTARTLQTAGLKRGDRVAIYLHKSLPSVISVFAIMKAGGVYVPLDPNAPVSRLAYITRNCDIRIMVTSSEMLEQLSQFRGEGSPVDTILVLDDSKDGDNLALDPIRVIPWHEVLEAGDSPVPDPKTIETDLAYILYTSGSTGAPKGVMVSHRTILTFINWCNDTFGLQPGDRVTSHAPLHFDLSTFDLYATIKGGGTIALVPEKLSVFPIQLVRFLQEERITVTYLVPSILSLMVNYGKLADHSLSSLRLVLFAGEVFPIKYLRQLVSAVPHPEYYNLYGPTETNVCTYYKVKTEDLGPEQTKPVPIGIACENTEVFALSEGGSLVTRPGEEGELWVRGPCVAQGYWGDAEKTDRSFIRNPSQAQFFELAYRTGDIVTLHEDSVNWEFIGRKDHMIKSRGYRIELGEIESALYSHTLVSEAAVVAVPDDLVGNRIKAFVVVEETDRITGQDLLSHCKKLLPQYMVPETIEFLDQLPKTSTGKVNRPRLVEN